MYDSYAPKAPPSVESVQKLDAIIAQAHDLQNALMGQVRWVDFEQSREFGASTLGQAHDAMYDIIEKLNAARDRVAIVTSPTTEWTF